MLIAFGIIQLKLVGLTTRKRPLKGFPIHRLHDEEGV
jgi:hypothetical protein